MFNSSTIQINAHKPYCSFICIIMDHCPVLYLSVWQSASCNAVVASEVKLYPSKMMRYF